MSTMDAWSRVVKAAHDAWKVDTALPEKTMALLLMAIVVLKRVDWALLMAESREFAAVLEAWSEARGAL